jgi:anti-sigma regulatory factor (Ser/Thr protein kinase)
MDLVFDLAADPIAPTQARTAMLALTAAVIPAVLDDLRLLVTELVTNSVRHGPGGKIRVAIKVTAPDAVFAEITDGGTDGAVEIREAAEDGGGLGLRILDRIATRWGVYEGSTNVWFELRSEDAA